MAIWWQPWTWFEGAEHSDNFIRNLTERGSVFEKISEGEAIKVSAVLCAARVISEGVAQTPLKVYREEEVDGLISRKPATDHPAYMALHRRPNSWMTSFEWRELMTLHAVLRGNAFSIVNRVNGKVDELIPVDPAFVEVRHEDNAVTYRVTADGQAAEYNSDEIFHLRGPSLDGVHGLPIIRLASRAVGLARNIEHSQAQLARNGHRPSGILSIESEFTPERKKEIADAWKSKFGPDGEGGTAVLDGGWKYDAMTMKSTDAQTIENRRFQIEEIGRLFRVFPLMMMQSDKTATFASAEQFFLAHVVHTLMPWFERWEHSLDRVLLPEPEVYAHFVVNGLMRGAAQDRAEYYAKSLGAGGTPAWHTQNEIRGFEDEDPLPGGDILFAGSQNQGQTDAPQED